MTPKAVVLAFWEAMGTNDFTQASLYLTEDFEGHWPQSGELIRGRENFAALNSAYPANGIWRFELRSLVAEGDEVVTDVGVTDGTVSARAITFHRVTGPLIARQVEYWPDPFEPPAWRSRWVEVQPPDA